MTTALSGRTDDRIDALEDEVERLSDLIRQLGGTEGDAVQHPQMRRVKTVRDKNDAYTVPGATGSDMFKAVLVDVTWNTERTDGARLDTELAKHGDGIEPPIDLRSLRGYLNEGGIYNAYYHRGAWTTNDDSTFMLCTCTVVFDFETTDAEVVVSGVQAVFGVSPIASPPVEHDPPVTVCDPIGCDPLVDDPCTCRDMAATEMKVQNTIYRWSGTVGLPGHIIYHKSIDPGLDADEVPLSMWHFIQLRCPAAGGVSAETASALSLLGAGS